MAADPSKALTDSNGKPVLRHGDRAFPQPSSGMEVFDFSQESVQSWFAGAVVNMTKGGFVDACFQDRANEDSFPGVDKTRMAKYKVGHTKVLQTIQKELDPIQGFVVSNNKELPGVKATMLEAFAATEQSIQEVAALAAKGVVVQAHAGSRAATQTRTASQFSLAHAHTRMLRRIQTKRQRQPL